MQVTRELAGTPVKAAKLKFIIQNAMEDRSVFEEIEHEFQELVWSVVFIAPKSEEGFEGTNTMKMNDIVKSFIRITDVGDSNMSPHLRKTSLKILRNIIDLFNSKSVEVNSAYWTIEHWRQYGEEMKDNQDTILHQYGLINVICRVISFESNRLLKEEALLLGISVLMDGKSSTQNGFFEYMKEDNENVFLLSLFEVIRDNFELVRIHESKRINQLNTFIKSEQKGETFNNLGSSGEDNQPFSTPGFLETNADLESEELQLQMQDDDFDAEQTPINAIRALQSVLRLLQLLCENHNASLQNHLRQQFGLSGKVLKKSVDFVGYLTRLLGEFRGIFNEQTCDLGYQLVDTLIELIQGPCRENQRTLIHSKILESSRDYISGFSEEIEIVSRGFSLELGDLERINTFKQKIVTLLLSLLEGEEDEDIISNMSASLDFEIMKERLFKVFKLFAILQLRPKNDSLDVEKMSLSALNNTLKRDSFAGNIIEAFEIFILMHTLADSNDVARQNLAHHSFTKEQWVAFEFIRMHTGRIEVTVQGSLQRVYFPVHPLCHFLSYASRKHLIQNINRESASTKITGLITKIPELIIEMEHNEQLMQHKFRITPKKVFLVLK